MLDGAAILQGLTEFLPVSSSLHLELWALWQKIELTKDDEVSLHFGTLIALCVYFLPSKRWPSFAILVYVAVATVPAVCVGFYIKKCGINIPHSWLACSTIVGGCGLLLAEKIAQNKGPRQVNLWAAIAIGLAQVLAFIPGASRMGTTMTMARLMGVSVREALTFSWMLAIPTVGGAVALTTWDAWKEGVPVPLQINQIIITAVVGWCVMMLVHRYAQSALLKGCAYYRIALGLILFFIMK